MQYEEGFKDGYIAACRSFGTYRNGEQLIGTQEHNVREMAAGIQAGTDSWFNEKLKEAQLRRKERPHKLIWSGKEWVAPCGCAYHPDDDNGSHGGAPHVHRCEAHSG